MLIRTADLLDLASFFAPPLRVGRAAHDSEVFLVVRDGMLEAHRGPLHARVPLCVWARDRVLGWARWKALSDKHAPETMEVEHAVRLVDAPSTPVQTRAVFQQRGDRRGFVDAHLITADDRVQNFEVPPLGARVIAAHLTLVWAERPWRGVTPLSSRSAFTVSRFNLVIRPVPLVVHRVISTAVNRLIGDGDHGGSAIVPEPWLDEAFRALPHRDGLALVGRCWWADFGRVFENLSEA